MQKMVVDEEGTERHLTLTYPCPKSRYPLPLKKNPHSACGCSLLLSTEALLTYPPQAWRPLTFIPNHSCSRVAGIQGRRSMWCGRRKGRGPALGEGVSSQTSSTGEEAKPARKRQLIGEMTVTRGVGDGKGKEGGWEGWVRKKSGKDEGVNIRKGQAAVARSGEKGFLVPPY